MHLQPWLDSVTSSRKNRCMLRLSPSSLLSSKLTSLTSYHCKILLLASQIVICPLIHSVCSSTHWCHVLESTFVFCHGSFSSQAFPLKTGSMGVTFRHSGILAGAWVRAFVPLTVQPVESPWPCFFKTYSIVCCNECQPRTPRPLLSCHISSPATPVSLLAAAEPLPAKTASHFYSLRVNSLSP